MPTATPGPALSQLPPPVQPKEISAPPRGEDWMYEFLWSGERVRAIKDERGVGIVGRDGRNLVNRFPRVAAALAKLRAAEVAIDGEILMLDGYSPAAVALLAQASDDITQAQVALLAYDLLRHGNVDMRETPLLGRRVVLASIVQGTPIILSPLFAGPPEAALAEAARLGLRGIVTKRAGSYYRPNALATPWHKVLLNARPAAEGRGRGRGAVLAVARAPSSLALPAVGALAGAGTTAPTSGP